MKIKPVSVKQDIPTHPRKEIATKRGRKVTTSPKKSPLVQRLKQFFITLFKSISSLFSSKISKRNFIEEGSPQVETPRKFFKTDSKAAKLAVDKANKQIEVITPTSKPVTNTPEPVTIREFPTNIRKVVEWVRPLLAIDFEEKAKGKGKNFKQDPHNKEIKVDFDEDRLFGFGKLNTKYYLLQDDVPKALGKQAMASNNELEDLIATERNNDKFFEYFLTQKEGFWINIDSKNPKENLRFRAIKNWLFLAVNQFYSGALCLAYLNNLDIKEVLKDQKNFSHELLWQIGDRIPAPGQRMTHSEEKEFLAKRSDKILELSLIGIQLQ